MQLNSYRLILLLTLGVGACTDAVNSSQRALVFSPQTQTVTIEVDYQEGAEPIITRDTIFSQRANTWEDIVRPNIEAMLAEDPKELALPTALDGMEKLAPSSQESYTVDDILKLAEQHRGLLGDEQNATYYVLFLNGFFQKNGEANPTTLGVNLGDTGVIAMFSPVIKSSDAPSFVEATTIVHELGHAIGLVATGLPPVDDHHDSDNGAHCTNTDCVMYFRNEGRDAARDFLRRIRDEGTVIVFGDECLEDIRIATRCLADQPNDLSASQVAGVLEECAAAAR